MISITPVVFFFLFAILLLLFSLGLMETKRLSSPSSSYSPISFSMLPQPQNHRAF